ncbi:T9SS type A sorting domain-containing protein [Mucilaginibacter myungsuensis]|uniref:T9SS type A sorting domain-containing protein n=1 Tax=Mucilaginibacter myungsuensis TaxID=649104 RepID=A0A929KYK0_9SPHI|nr:T9SS type A sorting domain-containing protein [Mucilaginibacter myungsuensis]MBE9663537.1 T9SS type A sorting domain-containing protein [Mucilaginibacter myungsuensis]MDN3600275.1 T9SS type A sorting domain-containing protein [Mucilaginibacter myungsuensis]
MKTIIKTSALFFGIALFTTAAFAADKADKDKSKEVKQKQHIVAFNSLTDERGVQVIVQKAKAASTGVKIYDEAGHLVLSHVMAKKDLVAQKGYDLTQLDAGDYTFQVTVDGEVTKKLVHVYESGKDQRSFFFKQ